LSKKIKLRTSIADQDKLPLAEEAVRRTIARTTLAAWDLLNKRLVRPFNLALPLSKSYWIVCPKATSALPKIMTFRDWLLAEAADDVRCLNALASA
jgi:LysR family transcriptional regulator, glycine cleavage system transcriptional activator